MCFDHGYWLLETRVSSPLVTTNQFKKKLLFFVKNFVYGMVKPVCCCRLPLYTVIVCSRTVTSPFFGMAHGCTPSHSKHAFIFLAFQILGATLQQWKIEIKTPTRNLLLNNLPQIPQTAKRSCKVQTPCPAYAVAEDPLLWSKRHMHNINGKRSWMDSSYAVYKRHLLQESAKQDASTDSVIIRYHWALTW